jgi:hypothetical protein
VGAKVAQFARISVLVKGLMALFLFGVALSIATSASAELIHGFAYHDDAFDFERQQSVFHLDPSADLILGYVADPPLGYRTMGQHGAELVLMSGMTWEEVTVAPGDTSLYYWDLPLYQDSTYVIRTGEGHYAKFRVLVPGVFYFEYVYQSDGSRVLDGTVPTQVTTWGRIKELFRERR